MSTGTAAISAERIPQNRATVVLGIEGMVSPRSEHAVESALAKLPGVVGSASFAARTLRVEFDRNQCALPEIARRLDQLGYHIRPGGPKKPADQKIVTAPSAYLRCVTLIRSHHKVAMAIVGALMLLGAVLTRAFDGPTALRYALVAGGFVLAGWYTAVDTFRVLREFRFDIDVLMFAAAFGAAAIGRYEEGAFLLVLF